MDTFVIHVIFMISAVLLKTCHGSQCVDCILQCMPMYVVLALINSMVLSLCMTKTVLLVLETIYARKKENDHIPGLVQYSR